MNDTINSTDCTFVIGGEEIQAHKHVLSNYSPVFEKMFFGKLASSRITIEDIPLDDFKKMLKYLYKVHVAIESVLHAWSLFYVAHKYLLRRFAAFCTTYVRNNLTVNNLLLNYEYADLYGVDDLKQAIMNEITDYVRGIFAPQCDYHMKPSTMIAVLEQRVLNITNDELVSAVLNWAVVECEQRDIADDANNIISLLKSLKIYDLLTRIEFKCDSNACESVYMASELIKWSQTLNFVSKKYSKRHWSKFSICRISYKIARRVELSPNDTLISNVSVNKDVCLFGLVVRTEEEKAGHVRCLYSGMIQIDISEIDACEILSSTAFFNKNILYHSSVYVPLSQVLRLESKKVYTVKIRYGNVLHDKSTVLWKYMSEKLIDVGKNVVFSFCEYDGGVIKGISYYPA